MKPGMTDRTSVLLGALLTLAGCGRGTPLFSQQQLVSSVQPDAGPTCRSTCTGDPAGLDTPLSSRLEGMPPLHWLACAGCVRVTLDPSLDERVASRVPSILKAWAAVTPGLCLALEPGRLASPLTPDQARVDIEQQIHVTASSSQVSTVLTYSTATGRLFNALVLIDPDEGDIDRALNARLGSTLGLGSGDPSRSAVHSFPDGLRVPGPGDAVSLGLLYGTPPHCER